MTPSAYAATFGDRGTMIYTMAVGWETFYARLDAVLRKMAHESFEMIVAIAQGGIIPAAFIQQEWGIPLTVVRINYRDRDNKPVSDDARLLETIDFPYTGRRILLVDDVSRTGKTLARASAYLKGNTVKTFLVNGRADNSLFETDECLLMPWKRDVPAAGLPAWKADGR